MGQSISNTQWHSSPSQCVKNQRNQDLKERKGVTQKHFENKEWADNTQLNCPFTRASTLLTYMNALQCWVAIWPIVKVFDIRKRGSPVGIVGDDVNCQERQQCKERGDVRHLVTSQKLYGKRVTEGFL